MKFQFIPIALLATICSAPLVNAASNKAKFKLAELSVTDTFTRSSLPNNSFGSDPEIVVGGWGDVYNGYLYFDVSALPLVNGNKVYLRLYNKNRQSGKAQPAPFKVARIMNPISNETRFSDKINIHTASEVSVSIVKYDDWTEVDITDIFTYWKKNGSNYGLALVPINPDNNFNFFVSGESGVDDAYKPEIEIRDASSGKPEDNALSADTAMRTISTEQGGEATTLISANKCAIEIRVATPEDWLDDRRMKDLVIKHGMSLFNEQSCMDWKGKPANEVKIYVRQSVLIEGKKWDGPCPTSIPTERRWMCAAPMGYVAGSLTGNHLGNFKDNYGAGVTAEIKRQAGATHEFFFGGRSFERINGDIYLVSYDNKALKTKRVEEEFRASDLRRAEAIASKETAALAAKRTHDANVASFRRQASLTLSPKDRGYGSAALEIMIENFFYFNDKAGRRARFKEGKDFLIVQAQYQTLSRADVANGVTSIIDVKSVALFKDRSVDPWKEFCSHNRFIRINNGPWKLNNGFSSC